jgi:type VI protein secretion system component VasK
MNKNTIHSPWLLVIVFIITAIIMTVYEVIKELIFKGTLTLWQSHTITIIVTSIIATLTASVMRSWVLSVYLKEKEIEAKEQSLKSFELVLPAVNHIVNNVLNYLQLVKIDIDANGKLPEETLELLAQSIKEADQQMKILNRIKAPNDPDSYKEIYPK